MKMIAFGHRKCIGKDTAARFLIAYLRSEKKIKNIQKVGFSDKVKDVAYGLYRWSGLQPGEYYETDENRKLREIKLPKIGLTPREIWIGVGNGLRLNCYERTWLDYLLNCPPCDVLVIKDMRFLTEAVGVKSKGGICIKIDRPGSPIDIDGADQALPDSPLKTLESYTEWDRILINDGNLNEFHHKIVTLANEIFV